MTPTLPAAQATTLQEIAASAIRTYPDEEYRIWLAFLLVHAGHVSLAGQGVVHVHDRMPPARITHCCDCGDDALPSARCVHHWAAMLHKWTIASRVPGEQPCVLRATYTPPRGTCLRGSAEWTPKGWLFTSDDGSSYDYVAFQALDVEETPV